MSTLGASLSGIAVSSCVLVVLARRDPMRLRICSARMSAPPVPSHASSPAQRRALTAIALAPGLALIVLSGWASFVIWAGVLLISGWALAGAMNRGRRLLTDCKVQ